MRAGGASGWAETLVGRCVNIHNEMKVRRSKYCPPVGKVLKQAKKNADIYWQKKRGEDVKFESSTLAALEAKLAAIGT